MVTSPEQTSHRRRPETGVQPAPREIDAPVESGAVLRDTDGDWNAIAANQPYFGVLANERYLLQNLSAEAKREFYETGDGDIDLVVEKLALLGGRRFKPAVALDFGCGVGRLTFAMAKRASHVIGVDVADAMLDIARNEATERRCRSVEFRRDIPQQGLDWVNSLIVFQHIPPVRGLELFEQLLELLAAGGYLSVQVTFFRDRTHTAEAMRDIDDYRYDGQAIELLSKTPPQQGDMTMYDYDLNKLTRLLFTHGIETVLLQHTNHGGCHGAWLFGVKV